MAALDCMIPRATLRAVNHQLADPRETIRSGQAILGIELGSTRIKAALIAPDTTPLAAGSHTWENRFENGLWTYALADIEAGLASSFASLVTRVNSGAAARCTTCTRSSSMPYRRTMSCFALAECVMIAVARGALRSTSGRWSSTRRTG